jgi:hypothetical protein
VVANRSLYGRSSGGRRPRERNVGARRRRTLARRGGTGRPGIAAHAGEVVARRRTGGVGAGERGSTGQMLDECAVPRPVDARGGQRGGRLADEGTAHGLTMGAIRDAAINEAEGLGPVGREDGQPIARARPRHAHAIRRRAARDGLKGEAQGAREAGRAIRTLGAVGGVGRGRIRGRGELRPGVAPKGARQRQSKYAASSGPEEGHLSTLGRWCFGDKAGHPAWISAVARQVTME